MDKIYRARRKRTRQRHAQSSRTFRSRLGALFTLALFVGVIGAVSFGVASFLVYRSYADDLKPPQEVISSQSVGQSIAYDRNGQPLYKYPDEFGQLRDPVPLAEISPYVIAATIATEDSSFYGNPGVNFRGLARAAWENLTPFGPGFLEGSGGSSITQQLARNVYIENEGGVFDVSPERKIKETVIALELKRNYSDDQILEWYLNQITYGRTYYGIEAAAQNYFGKPAADLTLAEAALLAGIPQSPNVYSPIDQDRRENAKARQNQVLDLMIGHLEEVNSIPTDGDDSTPLLTLTVEEIDAARDDPLEYIEPGFDIQAPHFVFYAGDQVKQMCEADLFDPPGNIPCDRILSQGGLRITTTVDLGLNAIAQRIIEEEISANEDFTGGHNASIVSIDPHTGQILAYVGSRNYYSEEIDGQVDIASSLQSHGSSMKVFSYLKAFEDGWVPSTFIEDKELFLNVGGEQRKVNNWNFSYLGNITVRKAMAESVNTAAVRTLMDVGEDRFRELAHRMGITDLRQGDCGPTITLGACEVQLVDQTFAYSVLANNGMMIGRPTSEDLPTGFREIDQVSVLQIADDEGNVLYSFDEPVEQRVVDPAFAYMVTDVLSKDAISWSSLTIDRPAATKTGTSEEFRDGVVMGYTPHLAVGVWMGNADNSPMAEGTFSRQGVGPMWMRFTTEASQYLDLPADDFEAPDSVVFLSCGGRQDVFKKNTPTVKNGACRGPSGRDGETATPTPKAPVFPTTSVTPTATPTPEATAAPTAGPEPPRVFYYTTREGDTLQLIAALFGVTVDDLVKANAISPDAPLAAGTVLVIPLPAPIEHPTATSAPG